MDWAATVHISSNRDNFSSYQKYDESQDIKAFGNNLVKGVGEGDIISEVEFKGKVMKICLTQVTHVPGTDGKILSLKRLDQKGFEIHILAGHLFIIRTDELYMEGSLSGDLYEVKMKIIPKQESVMATVKRDTVVTNLLTWHRRLGHLGDTMLKKLVNSKTIKGMDVTDAHLDGICLSKMDEKPFKTREDRDSQLFGTLHTNLIGLMNPAA